MHLLNGELTQLLTLNSELTTFHKGLSVGYSGLRHLCLKTNSDTSAEARVARSSDGKPYPLECCSWKVTYLTTIEKHLMRLTLLPSGEYLRHHKGFERGFQGVNLMGQKVPIYHALSGCKPVKYKSMYKIC